MSRQTNHSCHLHVACNAFSPLATKATRQGHFPFAAQTAATARGDSSACAEREQGAEVVRVVDTDLDTHAKLMKQFDCAHALRTFPHLPLRLSHI